MKSARAGHLYPLVTMILAPGLWGCATLTPQQDAMVTRVAKTETEDFRSAADLVVEDARWNDGIFTAKVRRQISCRRETRQRLIHQPVKRRETIVSGMLIDGIGGGLLTLSAIGLFAAAPLLSDEPTFDTDTGEELASSRNGALAFGILSLLGGGYMLWLVFDGATQAGDVESGRANEEWKTDPGREVLCDAVDPGAGAVEFAYADGGRYQTRVASGDVELDARASRRLFCSEEGDFGRELRLWYVADSSKNRVELTTYAADDCIHETVAESYLGQANKILASKPSIQGVGEAINLLDRADAHIKSLPPSHPSGGVLQSVQEKAKAKSLQVARDLADAGTAGYLRVVQKQGITAAIPHARAALALSQAVPEKQAEVWQKIYQAAVNAALAGGMEGVHELRSLLETDSTTTRCLADAESCPEWLPQGQARATFERVIERLIEQAARLAKSLHAATGSISKKPTLTTASDLTERLGTAELVSRECATFTWSDLAQAACENLTSSSNSGRAALTKAEPIINKARQESTTKKWRSYFGRCKVVISAIEQFNRDGCVGSQCDTIRAKLESDVTKLREFQVEDGWMEEAYARMIGQECSEARCPVCP